MLVHGAPSPGKARLNKPTTAMSDKFGFMAAASRRGRSGVLLNAKKNQGRQWDEYQQNDSNLFHSV